MDIRTRTDLVIDMLNVRDANYASREDIWSGSNELAMLRL